MKRAALLPGALAPLLFISISCQSGSVYVPPELASAPRLSVEGRSGWNPGQHLRFGEYETDRRESRLQQDLIGLIGNLVDAQAVVEPLGFQLTAPGRSSWRAACDPIARQLEGEPAYEDANPLRCSLTPEAPDTSSTWSLSVLDTPLQVPRGDLVSPDGRYEIVGTTQDGKGRVSSGDQAFGYHVLAGGQAVAAVEVVGGDAVWFAPSLAPERRDLLATTAAAVLLWDYLARTPL